MREWLSGGAPPCQGGGRGFDPRLALFLILKGSQHLSGFLFVCVQFVWIQLKDTWFFVLRSSINCHFTYTITLSETFSRSSLPSAVLNPTSTISVVPSPYVTVTLNVIPSYIFLTISLYTWRSWYKDSFSNCFENFTICIPSLWLLPLSSYSSPISSIM